MVNNLGRWTEEKDYSTYPEEKWCDYDHLAVWIRSTGYEIKTSMENLATMIFLHYDAALEETETGYYEIPYTKRDGNYAPNMEDIKAFVEASGGLKEFDYEA